MLDHELARLRIDELRAEAEREQLAKNASTGEPARGLTASKAARAVALVALLVSLSGWVLGVPALALIS